MNNATRRAAKDEHKLSLDRFAGGLRWISTEQDCPPPYVWANAWFALVNAANDALIPVAS